MEYRFNVGDFVMIDRKVFTTPEWKKLDKVLRKDFGKAENENVIFPIYVKTFFYDKENVLPGYCHGTGKVAWILPEFILKKVDVNKNNKHFYSYEHIQEARNIVMEEMIKMWEDHSAQGIFFSVYNDESGYQGKHDYPYKGRNRVFLRINNQVTGDEKYSHSFCSQNDEFNEDIGRMVAICKMTGRKLPDWIKG